MDYTRDFETFMEEMMDYIREINAFYDLQLSNQLSTGQIAVWHALMSICNKCHWSEWFSVANLTLELLTGLSRRAILDARNTLVQGGYIEVRPRGRKTTLYHLCSLLMAKSAQETSQDTAQETSQDTAQETSQDTATLKDEMKRNEMIHPPISPRRTLDNAIADFQKYRLSIKKPLSDNATILLRERLKKIASTDDERIAILDQSIMQGWSGIRTITEPIKNPAATDYTQRSYSAEDYKHIFVDLGV